MGRILIFVFLLVGCNQDRSIDHEKNDMVQHAEIGGSFVISDQEITKLEKLSQGGDGNASYALFMHHSFNSHSQYDSERADFWLKKASEQGYVKATDLLRKRVKNSKSL